MLQIQPLQPLFAARVTGLDLRRSRPRLASEAWKILWWCRDISPGLSSTSTADASSTSTAISWPRVSIAPGFQVSTCGTTSLVCVPGTMRIAPLSFVAGDSAIQTVTASSGSRCQ